MIMKKFPGTGQVIFNAEGGFERIGDYFAGNPGETTFSLQADGVRNFTEPAIDEKKSEWTLCWRDTQGKLEITARFKYDDQTGIISRCDTLTNRTKKKIVIRKYAARFTFNPGEYELYSQRSLWCHESQGEWTRLHSGSITLGSRAGRWCEGSTPFAVLRDSYSSHALAFLVFPEGDWMLRFSCRTPGGAGRLPTLTVEAGLSDDRLELELAPGECWQAPEVVIQILPGREAYSGTAAMNRWLNRRFPARADHYPVVYNTWLDRMSKLDVPRLESQLKAAKKCGCEVFVVDYGWYEDLNSFTRVNDWDECTNRAFFGKMRQFAGKVRKAGLGFGFWVEMEFFLDKSAVVRKNPGWFFPSEHPNIVCPKTWLPEVEDYLVDSLASTIRRYQAVYVKNDMNHSQGYEPAHLNRYQHGVFRVFARLREMFPEVSFENCSSGSHRMAAGGMMEVFDNHFISDNASPLENLRMFQGMLPRFAPGRIYHWYVGSELHPAPEPAASFESGMVLQPQSATWLRMQTEDLNFGLLCNLTGQIGFSCDLASFSPEKQARIAQYSAFYKRYRHSFLRSEAYLLTPPENFDKQRGWLVIQISDPRTDTHFLYSFHCICDGDEKRIFHLKSLKPETDYEVFEMFPQKNTMKTIIAGETLSRSGISVSFSGNQHLSWQGKLTIIKKVKA